MNIRIIIKRLSHPQVRKRLKIALSVYAAGIIIGIGFKMVYDIGYFNAQTIKNNKMTELPVKRPVLTMESAQRIVSGALKEDPANPQTIVIQVIDDNYNLSTIMIENKKIRKIAWIIEMRLFFAGDIFNAEGYNLTEGIERQHDIIRSGY